MSLIYSKKTKILVVTNYFKPAYKAGGPIRSLANMVDHLKDSDSYSFFILTGDRDFTLSSYIF